MNIYSQQYDVKYTMKFTQTYNFIYFFFKLPKLNYSNVFLTFDKVTIHELYRFNKRYNIILANAFPTMEQKSKHRAPKSMTFSLLNVINKIS